MGFTKPVIGDAGVVNDPKAFLPELNDQNGNASIDIPRSPSAVTIIPNLVFGNRQVEGTALRMNFADGSVRPGTTK